MRKKVFFLQRHDGNALIEVAVVLPVMTVMLFSVLNLGIILNQDLRVADSVRSAALTATVRAYATNLTLVKTIATNSAVDIPGYVVTAVTSCTCANGSGAASCTDHTSCGTYGIPNQYITVTAAATLPLLFKVPGFPSSYNVKSVAINRTPWTGTQ